MDRRLLLFSLIAVSSVALPNFVRADSHFPRRHKPFRLNLINQQTGETFSGIYRDDHGPLPEVMEDLSVFLRDFHSGERICVDVGVIDFLSHVMQAAGQSAAQRSSPPTALPETNEKLAETRPQRRERTASISTAAHSTCISARNCRTR